MDPAVREYASINKGYSQDQKEGATILKRILTGDAQFIASRGRSLVDDPSGVHAYCGTYGKTKGPLGYSQYMTFD